MIANIQYRSADLKYLGRLRCLYNTAVKIGHRSEYQAQQ